LGRSARRSGASVWDARTAAAGISGVARSELTAAGNAAGVQAMAWVEPVGGVPQVQLRVRAAGAADWVAPIFAPTSEKSHRSNYMGGRDTDSR
jgi:hypothetical protein